MKTVLVTGATGFVGRYSLPALLKRNFEVHAVTLTPPPAGTSHHNLIWHQVDLLQTDTVQRLMTGVKPSHLLHFAWHVEHGKYMTAPENKTWLEASTQLVGAFIKNGGKRFVGAGSCIEYDWSHGNCSETQTPLAPRGLYGEAKSEFHQRLALLNKVALPTYAWGRIFYLFGPGEPATRLIPVVIKALLDGAPLPPILYDRERDYMFVEDVADAFAAVLDTQYNGPVNIASGLTVKLKDLVETIAVLLGKPMPVLSRPDFKDPEPQRFWADVKVLREKIRWKPQNSLQAGLKKTIEAMRG